MMAKRVAYLLSIILLTNTYRADPPNFLIFYIDGQVMADWTESQPDPYLHEYTVVYDDAPTPNVNAFRSEAIVFSRAYAGGSVCSPSRYSLLTGRYCTRSKFGRQQSISKGIGKYSTFVAGGYTMMAGYDNTYNMAATMQNAGYYTATVGKWHLMAQGDGAERCATLLTTPDVDVYEYCIQKIAESTGFDFVDAFYYGNILTDFESPYDHNPEWVVSQAQKAITAATDADKPFFLYIAPTLEHDPPLISNTETVFTDHTYLESPKGTLVGDDIPDDTLMTPRLDIWDYIVEQGFTTDGKAAFAVWMDDMFGAVINYLKAADLYDNTFIMFGNDHGVKGRDTPYEQGIRTMQFIRYPKLFPVTDGPYVVSGDLITAGYDIPAVIYEIVGIDIDDEYVMDGESWLKDVQNMLSGTEDDISCCKERHSDIWYSHAIVHNEYKYMFKANNVPYKSFEEYWPYYYHHEQMYNLDTDPSEQYDILSGSMTHKEKAKARTFRAKMERYINEVACPLTESNCVLPSNEISFVCANEVEIEKEWDGIVDADYDINAMLSEAEQEITCDYSEYAYRFREGEKVLALDMIVCCGSSSSGSFGGKYDKMYTVTGGLNAVQNDALNEVQNEALNEVRRNKKRFFETNGLMLWIILIAFCAVYCISALFCRKPKGELGEYVALLNSNDENSKEPNIYGCPSV